MLPPQAERVIASVHVAMFDAVNSIEPRYRPYRLLSSPPKDASTEAAAAVAAGMVLAGLASQGYRGIEYIGWRPISRAIPSSAAKSDGIKVGQEVAAKIVAERKVDGADAPDAYRPKTRPGVYVPTPITASSMWPNVKPFAMKSPVAIPAAAADLAQERGMGDRLQRDQEPRWQGQHQADCAADRGCTLLADHRAGQLLSHRRQLVAAKRMDVVDSARFMALASTAVADTFIAVFDAKYHYDFWRPITAIRNGDMDDNPATELDATWQPIDNTPMHPEYPCAHCISSATVATVIEAVLGSADIPEVTHDEPDRARRHAPLDQCLGLCRRSGDGTHLCRFPLSVLDPRRSGHGSARSDGMSCRTSCRRRAVATAR